MDIMQTGTVLAIVVITYLIGAAAKLIPHIKDEYIPVIVGAAGGVLGIAGIYCSEFSIGQNLCARRAAFFTPPSAAAYIGGERGREGWHFMNGEWTYPAIRGW